MRVTGVGQLLALWCISLLFHLWIRWGAGLWGALGTDAPLWGLTARDLLVGASPLVPPGYPALTAGLLGLGLPLVPAAVAVSMVATAAIPPAVYRVARLRGASAPVAVLAALLVLISPDVAAWAQQVQPDGLAALLIVLLAGSLAGMAEHPRSRPQAALHTALLGALLPLVREHGLLLALLSGLLLLLAGRWGPWLVLLVLLLLLPLAFGGGTAPWDQPWTDRSSGALAVFQATRPEELPFLRELHRGERAAYLELIGLRDRWGQLRWHAGRAVSLSGDGLLLLVLGLVVGWRSSLRPGLWLPLLVGLPVLLIWSQRRHVLLLLPLALVVIAAGAPRKGRWALPVLLITLGGLVPPLLQWPETLGAWQNERPRAEHYAELAGWIEGARGPTPALLGGLYQDIGLYAPLPRHDPDGSEADWLTWFVSEGPPLSVDRDEWRSVYRGQGRLQVWRREPDRRPRPCAEGRALADTPHLAVGMAHARVSGCVSDGQAPARSD